MAPLVGITTRPSSPPAGTTRPATWLAAVQWHPEMTAADDAPRQRLCDGLVEAVTGGDAPPGADPATPEGTRATR